MTPRTRLIIITSPHNPTGVAVAMAALDEVGRIAERAGRARPGRRGVPGRRPTIATPPAAARGDVFLTTSSLTKSYGLAEPARRLGHVAGRCRYRVQRARDVVDGTGSIVAERLATLAFEQLDALTARARGDPRAQQGARPTFLQSRPELEWVPLGRHDRLPAHPRRRGRRPVRRRLMRERSTALGPGLLRRRALPARLRRRYGEDSRGAGARGRGAGCAHSLNVPTCIPTPTRARTSRCARTAVFRVQVHGPMSSARLGPARSRRCHPDWRTARRTSLNRRAARQPPANGGAVDVGRRTRTRAFCRDRGVLRGEVLGGNGRHRRAHDRGRPPVELAADFRLKAEATGSFP